MISVVRLSMHLFMIYSEWMAVPFVCHCVTAWTHCFLSSWLLNFFTHYFLSSYLINNINECFRKEVKMTFADWLPSLSTSVKPHCLKSLHSSEFQAVGYGTFWLPDAHSLSIQVEGYVDGWSWWDLNKHRLHRQRISDWEPWISGIIILSAVFVHILFFCLSYFQYEYVKEPQ